MAKHIHIYLGKSKAKDFDKQAAIAFVKSKIEAANNELSRGKLDKASHAKEIASLNKELKRLNGIKDAVEQKNYTSEYLMREDKKKMAKEGWQVASSAKNTDGTYSVKFVK